MADDDDDDASQILLVNLCASRPYRAAQRGVRGPAPSLAIGCTTDGWLDSSL